MTKLKNIPPSPPGTFSKKDCEDGLAAFREKLFDLQNVFYDYSRCLLSIEQILTDLVIEFTNIRLGKIALKNPLADDKMMADLKARLERVGFELQDDQRRMLIEQIKNTIVRLVFETDKSEAPKINLSETLSRQFLKNYPALTTPFSEVEGTTIERYFISQKIERAKELLAYDELTLSEIADLMGYCSVSHLSRQIKQITGLTPTHFKSDAVVYEKLPSCRRYDRHS